MTRGPSGSSLALWASVALVACNTDGALPPLELPDAAAPAPGPTRTWEWAANWRTRIDLLFVIDNGDGMEPIQAELKNKFGELLKTFMDSADQGTFADLHIGVITTDLGAGVAGAPGCDRGGGGDGGRLQAVGRAADPSCLPPKDGSYIHYAFGPSGPSQSNLPGNQGLVQTFTCMASVGTSGCRYPHTLEATRRALTGGLPENQGFLRDDAGLVVVFATNKDDGSAAAGSPLFGDDRFGYPGRYQRQIRRGVVCGPEATMPPDDASGAPLGDCHAAPNGFGDPTLLLDVGPYVALFYSRLAEGGAKDDPTRVMVFGITGPSSPFQVIRADPRTPWPAPYVQCSPLQPAGVPPCVAVLERSCSSFGGALSAEPAVRLNQVIAQAGWRQRISTCSDDYTALLERTTRLLDYHHGPQCLTAPLPVDPAGQLVVACAVVDETRLGDGTVRAGPPLPRCDPTDVDAAHAKVPCWTVSRTPSCASLSPDGVELRVDRGRDPSGVKNQPPAGTTVRATCAVAP